MLISSFGIKSQCRQYKFSLQNLPKEQKEIKFLTRDLLVCFLFSPRVERETMFLIYLRCVKFSINPSLMVRKAL